MSVALELSTDEVVLRPSPGLLADSGKRSTKILTRKRGIYIVNNTCTVFSRLNAPSIDPAFNRGPAFINEMQFSAIFPH